MRQRLALSLIVALGSLSVSRPARAASCSFTEVVPVAFGAYSPFSGASGVATGWVVYQCSLFNALDLVTVDLSFGSSGKYLPWRVMLSDVGNHPLQYNLYTDAALTKVFGDGTGGTFHTGPLALPVIPTKVFIYGFIPASQNAWTGNYSDLITVTMNF